MGTSKEFIGIDHGIEQIGISGEGKIVLKMRPTEIHIKQDGTKDNLPSLCIVMDTLINRAYGEISLKMFNEGLADIGYEIIKKQ